MKYVNLPAGQPQRTGQSDIVLTKHFKHFRSGQPHDKGHLIQPQSDAWQDKGFQATAGQKACRPPAQNDTTSPRPNEGSQLSSTEKIQISKTPIKKVGNDTPIRDDERMKFVKKLPLLIAV